MLLSHQGSWRSAWQMFWASLLLAVSGQHFAEVAGSCQGFGRLPVCPRPIMNWLPSLALSPVFQDPCEEEREAFYLHFAGVGSEAQSGGALAGKSGVEGLTFLLSPSACMVKQGTGAVGSKSL